jgi:hypothetical protein
MDALIAGGPKEVQLGEGGMQIGQSDDEPDDEQAQEEQEEEEQQEEEEEDGLGQLRGEDVGLDTVEYVPLALSKVGGALAQRRRPNRQSRVTAAAWCTAVELS